MLRWTTLAITLASAFSIQGNFSRQLEAGHPYQDRYSSQGSVSTRSGLSSAYPSSAQFATEGEMPGSCHGSGGNCPRPTHAQLQLWVPDEATVYINGQRTQPQSLGGIHKNSRIYTLEGLGDGPKPVEIVVELCRQPGQLEQMQYSWMADLGGHYKVHYPSGFAPSEAPIFEHSHEAPTPIDESAIPHAETQVIIPQSSSNSDHLPGSAPASSPLDMPESAEEVHPRRESGNRSSRKPIAPETPKPANSPRKF